MSTISSAPQQQFSLRYHKASISYILPISSRYIYSADQSGLVIKWDLQIRRPKLQWQAHKDSILTILQWHQYIVTHSRDSTIKVWLEDVLQFEMPVNALNYTNIVLYRDNYLITPATLDSNNVDVYKLKQHPIEVSRVIANFSIFELVNKTRTNMHANMAGDGVDVNVKYADEIGIDDKDNMQGRQDFGIIMKMLVIDMTIYIGFESGDIVGLHLEVPESKLTRGSNSTLLINREPRLKLEYQNTLLVPNPVISLANLNGLLVSGSTGTKVVIHSDPTRTVKFHLSGIHSIQTYHDRLVIGFWDGAIEYKGEIIQRPLPQIKGGLDSNSNGDDENEEENLKSNVKLTSMTLSNFGNSSSSDTAKVQHVRKPKYSEMVKGKLMSDAFFAGYEDGTIMGYALI